MTITLSNGTTRDLSPLERGTRVRFTSYGEHHEGKVIRDNGNGIVWIESRAGAIFRERFMHRESIEVIA